ncbi:MAG: dTMP kinase [Anaerolineales bacterium]|nr:dTMP kinase [Anaerolineales bacterium]
MFITFEGPEGCGKTTQIASLAEALKPYGYPILTTREPGGTEVGDQVRKVLLRRENTSMLERTEILLFQASRAQLVEEVIRPHLRSGGVVICDRFADSTIAYQGYGYQRDLDQLRLIVDFAVQGLKPDLTILLDLDVERGLQRRSDDGNRNRLDVYDVEFYRRVRRGYHDLVAAEPERWVVVDAARPPEEVQQDVIKTVIERLEKFEPL